MVKKKYSCSETVESIWFKIRGGTDQSGSVAVAIALQAPKAEMNLQILPRARWWEPSSTPKSPGDRRERKPGTFFFTDNVPFQTMEGILRGRRARRKSCPPSLTSPPLLLSLPAAAREFTPGILRQLSSLHLALVPWPTPWHALCCLLPHSSSA